MATRKRLRDTNQFAKLIVDVATGKVDEAAPKPGPRGRYQKRAARSR